MIGQFKAGLQAGHGRRLWRLAVVPATIVVVMLGLAATASAVTGARAAARDTALRTLVSHVSIRSQPNAHARVVARIARSGTAVTADCYALGSTFAGNAIWYHLVKPDQGYIASYYTDTHADPVSGLPECAARPAFSRAYHAVVKGLHMRQQPASYAALVKTLGPVGSRVVVTCYADGENVSGDKVWYRTSKPAAAWISGFYLNTGQDPAAGVPRCK